MNEYNKQNLKWFGKVVAILIPSFIALISFAGILNAVVDGLDAFYGWVGGINLGIQTFLLCKFGKSLFKD